LSSAFREDYLKVVVGQARRLQSKKRQPARLPYNLEVLNVIERTASSFQLFNDSTLQRFQRPAAGGGTSGLDRMREVALSESGISH